MKKQLLFTASILPKKLQLTFLFTFVLFSCLTTFAQENNTASFIKTQQALSSTPELGSLLYDLQSTIFINEDNVNQYGDGNFKVIECAPSRTAQLYEKNPLYASVKVIKVKINSPQDAWTINLSNLVSFDNLEYIQIVYTYDVCENETDACLPALVQNRIIGARPLTVLYELSMGH